MKVGGRDLLIRQHTSAKFSSYFGSDFILKQWKPYQAVPLLYAFLSGFDNSSILVRVLSGFVDLLPCLFCADSNSGSSDVWPCSRAKSSGVHPMTSWTCGSAPALSNAVAASFCPWKAASWSAVVLSSSHLTHRTFRVVVQGSVGERFCFLHA